MNLRRHKKASIQDVVLIAVVLFIMSIIILVVYRVNDEINTEFQAHEKMPDTSKTAMTQVNNMFPGVIDNSFLVVVVMLAIGAFVLASLVRVHPVFIIFFLIVLAIIIFLCAVFSNIYEEMATTNAEMTAIADDLTMISHILDLLPFIVGVLGSVLAIVMYKLWSVGQEFG